MDYRLHVFRLVAEELNFTKAAKRLRISQPAVTKHVQTLEEEFNRPLFDRTTTGIKLTAAGRILLDHAQTVARLDGEIVHNLQSDGEGLGGTLRIGATSTIGQYLLPRWLVQSRKAWPKLRLEATTGNTEEIVGAVMARKVDFGLIEGRYQRAGLRAEAFLEDEIVCVGSPRHPLAKKKSLAVQDLAQVELIFREQGSGTRDMVEAALRRQGWPPGRLAIDLELSSSEAIKAVVTAGHGLAFLSRFVVRRELREGTLKILPVANLCIHRKLTFIHLRGPRPGGAMGAFLDLILRDAPLLGK